MYGTIVVTMSSLATKVRFQKYFIFIVSSNDFDNFQKSNFSKFEDATTSASLKTLSNYSKNTTDRLINPYR